MVEGKPVDIVYVDKNGVIKIPDTIRRLINTNNPYFAVYVETKHGKPRMIWKAIFGPKTEEVNQNRY